MDIHEVFVFFYERFRIESERKKSRLIFNFGFRLDFLFLSSLFLGLKILGFVFFPDFEKIGGEEGLRHTTRQDFESLLKLMEPQSYLYACIMYLEDNEGNTPLDYAWSRTSPVSRLLQARGARTAKWLSASPGERERLEREEMREVMVISVLSEMMEKRRRRRE